MISSQFFIFSYVTDALENHQIFFLIQKRKTKLAKMTKELGFLTKLERPYSVISIYILLLCLDRNGYTVHR